MGRKRQYPQDCRWIQRDRTVIRVGDMTDSHIANCIRMLRRQADKYLTEAGACATYPGNPDGMGAYYADAAMDEAIAAMHEKINLIEMFMDELKRRHPNVQIYIRSDDERLPRLRL